MRSTKDKRPSKVSTVITLAILGAWIAWETMRVLVDQILGRRRGGDDGQD